MSSNVGIGLGYSVRQILDVIRADTGEAVPFTLRERRPGDPPIVVADPTKVERRLHFKAAALTAKLQSLGLHLASENAASFALTLARSRMISTNQASIGGSKVPPEQDHAPPILRDTTVWRTSKPSN